MRGAICLILGTTLAIIALVVLCAIWPGVVVVVLMVLFMAGVGGLAAYCADRNLERQYEEDMK